LSDTEKEKGYILACQSKVVEDVTVEIPPEILERKLKAVGMGREAAERLKGIVKEIEPMLHLIAQGLPNRAIGERLFVALDTVKGHNRNIFGKLQVQRRTESVARARELGLL
jgi:ATP/maltotriose-dependent transcriptional regulator MalT